MVTELPIIDVNWLQFSDSRATILLTNVIRPSMAAPIKGVTNSVAWHALLCSAWCCSDKCQHQIELMYLDVTNNACFNVPVLFTSAYLKVKYAPISCPTSLCSTSVEVKCRPTIRHSSMGPQGHASASPKANVHQTHNVNKARDRPTLPCTSQTTPEHYKNGLLD